MTAIYRLRYSGAMRLNCTPPLPKPPPEIQMWSSTSVAPRDIMPSEWLGVPQARIYAFDVIPKAQDICKRAAIANQVGDRVVVAGKCAIELLRPVVEQAGRPLLFIVQGAELELLDPVKLPETLHCDMIIECHDCLNPLITQTLKQRFSASHDIENIFEGPRDPNQFVSLRRWESLDRWLAIDEGRPVTMNWLVCWAR